MRNRNAHYSYVQEAGLVYSRTRFSLMSELASRLEMNVMGFLRRM